MENIFQRINLKMLYTCVKKRENSFVNGRLETDVDNFFLYHPIAGQKLASGK